MRFARALAPGLLALASMLCGCGNQAYDPLNTPLPAGETTQDLLVGDGPLPLTGQTLTVSYVLTLTDGTKVDSTIDRGRDFSFRMGSGDVIRGLDLGVASMHVGGHRKITIPPELAYGATGSPPSIPANATLIYDLWLSAAR